MKKLFLILALITMACSAQGVQDGTPIRSGKPTQENSDRSTVIAETALYLRDAPEDYGGKVLTYMPRGSQVRSVYCQNINGSDWVFGYYTDVNGKSWVGWMAAKYIVGGCK